ncbi:hypothetical protein [Dictyobacter kobayashii]|uniref:Uncharacterized protein n=1 Tax=Dictyobacter kobayashii TaxID=2014872 RepID=A0A402AZE3_9CHLR|nr:hypothetical protein [Dictyobacter kobayashii]GCE24476.1 hypothetical protein KDK_82760 [Dictyobacter kobayashii]
MNIGRQILRLYPRPWRDRYEDEMLAMLEQCSPSLKDEVNLLLGVCDAHLHPHWGLTGKPPYEKVSLMRQTLLYSLLTIFAAYVGFIIAGLTFQKISEYRVFMLASQTDTTIGLSFTLVLIGSVVALLGILVGGLPIVATVIKHAFTQRRPDQLFLLATPILAFAAFLGILFLLEKLPFTTLTVILSRSAFAAVFLMAATISTGALCRAVARCEIAQKHLRFALHAATLATVAMILMLMATISWGLGLWSKIPQFFMRNDGIFGSSTSLTWIGIVAAMTITTMLALIALMRGLSTRSILSTAIE